MSDSADKAASLTGINCTTCAASLPVLAGHKAKSLICSYCGSVMDRHDGYKVLQQYRDMPRPSGPFRLGMSGDVLGIPHTIVGIVGMKSVIEGETYRWTDYQIYSPTHGYSWLTWNSDHLVHSRKVRGDITDFRHFSRKMPFSAMGRDYKMFEGYVASISYLEGELTWVPKLGDETGVAEGVAPPYGFSAIRTGEEIEHETQTYIEDPAALLASFGADAFLPSPSDVHPLQPYRAPNLSFASKMAAACAAVSLLLAIVFGVFRDGSVLAQGTLDDTRAGTTVAFDAPSPSMLMSVSLAQEHPGENGNYNFVLTHTASGNQRTFGASASTYQPKKIMKLRPLAEGPHTLDVKGEPRYIDDPYPKPATITVRSGLYVPDYMIIVAFLFGLIALTYVVKRFFFEQKRWSDA